MRILMRHLEPSPCEHRFSPGELLACAFGNMPPHEPSIVYGYETGGGIFGAHNVGCVGGNASRGLDGLKVAVGLHRVCSLPHLCLCAVIGVL